MIGSAPPGDITANGRVDFTDYAHVALNWLDQQCVLPDFCLGADLNQDGRATPLDLQTLPNDWLPEDI